DHAAARNVPVIVYTDKDISAEAQKQLDELSSSAVVKTSDSSEKLLDDVSIFLHRMNQDASPKQQQTLKMLHDQDAMLVNRRVLVVDDDMRNLYALKSLLNKAGLKVALAENGQLAIDKINAIQPQDAFELIIMDIMMPVKDGYETMQEIRQMPDYANTPILAVTAKAMPEDRAKCLAAGASDYMNKPVDVERLMSMLRVWLYQRVQA
ncbi:MAG: response regulator, partial [Desulfobulbaceae bacterium]|nr:response regulator [Desulfobulbaceae bacterium]